VNLMVAIKVLLLISVANSAPLFAKRYIFKDHAGHPIDNGTRLWDGQFLFGPTKTIEGLISSATTTAVAGYVIGLGIYAGMILSSGAMAGDLASSFVKRRFGFPPSSKATGLDQIPESLLPSLLAASILPLTAGDIAVIVGLFLCGEMILSWVLYRIGVREQPY
jgi:CDP-diglyceride synthetase